MTTPETLLSARSKRDARPPVAGSRRFARRARRAGPRRGAIYVHDFRLAGIWVSALVDGGDGTRGDGAAELRALGSLVGAAVDGEYVEAAASLEGAALLCAETGPDGAACAVLGSLYAGAR